MTYSEVRQTVARAWGAFEHQLKIAGFTDSQVDVFKNTLDCKDGYNAVIDAVMEATR